MLLLRTRRESIGYISLCWTREIGRRVSSGFFNRHPDSAINKSADDRHGKIYGTLSNGIPSSRFICFSILNNMDLFLLFCDNC